MNLHSFIKKFWGAGTAFLYLWTILSLTLFQHHLPRAGKIVAVVMTGGLSWMFATRLWVVVWLPVSEGETANSPVSSTQQTGQRLRTDAAITSAARFEPISKKMILEVLFWETWKFTHILKVLLMKLPKSTICFLPTRIVGDWMSFQIYRQYEVL